VSGRDVNYEYKYYLSSTDLERIDVIKDIAKQSKRSLDKGTGHSLYALQIT